VSAWDEVELAADTAAIILKQLRDQAYLAERDAQDAYDALHAGASAGEYASALASEVASTWERLIKGIENGLLDCLSDTGEVTVR
jgi:hypothetical protein